MTTSSQPPERMFVDVRVTSRDPEQIEAFIQACKTIAAMSAEGSSGALVLHVDGDGAADLGFDFGDTATDEVEPLEVGDDGEYPPIGIGV